MEFNMNHIHIPPFNYELFLATVNKYRGGLPNNGTELSFDPADLTIRDKPMCILNEYARKARIRCPIYIQLSRFSSRRPKRFITVCQFLGLTPRGIASTNKASRKTAALHVIKFLLGVQVIVNVPTPEVQRWRLVDSSIKVLGVIFYVMIACLLGFIASKAILGITEITTDL